MDEMGKWEERLEIGLDENKIGLQNRAMRNLLRLDVQLLELANETA